MTRSRALMGACGLALTAAVSFGQGSLTPPGPPAPLMKTLDQIEPRTVITNLPWTISAPGGYVVDRNLPLASGNGISVTVSDVTLDLNGFVLTGNAGGGGHGIHVAPGIENVTIRNGILRDWGADGIHAPDASDISIRNIQVYGVGGNGVSMNKAELIEAMAKDCALAGVRMTKQTQGISFGERVKAIANGGGGIVIVGPGEVRIIDSDISGNTGHGISWISAEANETFRLSLGGVTCDDNTIDGIHVDLSGTTASTCTFIDGRHVLRAGFEGTSRANNNGGHGVYVAANAADAYLMIGTLGGEFSNNSGHGMYIEGGNKGSIDLDGSDFSGNAQAGLRVINEEGLPAPKSVKKITASGNGGHGIHVQGGIWRFSNCRAAGNGGDGIRAERATAGVYDRWGELIFETNDLIGNTGAGLNIPAVTGSVTGTVIIAGGLFSGNATAGIIIADEGVKPGSVNKVAATGNGGHGIAVAGHDFRIEDNLVARNAGSGIRVTGTGTHVARNQCSGNVTGVELVGVGNAARENVFGGDASQTPISATLPGNAVAPTQDVEAGNNPLGNVAY